MPYTYMGRRFFSGVIMLALCRDEHHGYSLTGQQASILQSPST
jgi:hypothetical protein